MSAPAAAGRLLVLTAIVIVTARAARAEPAFAVRTGYPCSQCHTNRTGGGLRTEFGSLYTQLTLPARTLRVPGVDRLLPADPSARFAAGADVRARYVDLSAEDGPGSASFELNQANVFVEARLVPDRVSLYLDETVGPAGAGARELFGLIRLPGPDAYLKVGKFLPSFGWRLPDDGAYVRRFTGFTYSAPDTGVEFGMEPGAWSIHVSAVNGASGGVDDNESKQLTLRSEWRIGTGRIGMSAANNLPAGARVTQGGLYGGINLGRVALLGEVDWREVRQQGIETRGLAGLGELDVLIQRGLNLKLAHDYYDPDTDRSTDARTRDSIGIEYTPIPFVQLRGFVRVEDGPPQLAGTRSDLVELELHLFF